jgi:peptide/nickel transport system substrate-binding protein
MMPGAYRHWLQMRSISAAAALSNRGNSAAATLVLAACVTLRLGLGCRPAAPAPDAVEVLVANDPATLDPRFATRGLDVKLTRLIHAGLVSLDPNTLQPKPFLAKSIERHGLDLAIELEDVRFHGGKPLEPSDVCATIDAIRDPRTQSPHRSVIESYASCVPTGPRALQLHLNGPRGSFLSDLEIPILRADEARAAPRNDGQLDGLGPFRVIASHAGAIELAPATHRQRPARYPLVIRTVHDENARAMRLLAGRSEVAPNAFSPALLRGFAEKDPSLTVRRRPGSNITYLLTRTDRAPWDSADKRRALSLAIDRDLIVKQLLVGTAKTAKWLIPDGHWAAPSDLVDLRYDPAAARTQLTSIGPVTLLTSTDRSRVLLARAIAQMFSDVGLPTQVVPLELGLLLSRLDAGQFSLAILQIPEVTDPNILSWFFHPRGIGEGQNLGRNRARYRSETAARLLDAASNEFDPEQRRRYYVELAKVMLADMPVIPLWHEDQIVVARGRGLRFMPSAEGRWWTLAEL